MKRLWFIALAMLLIVSLASAALAWEFKLKGTGTFEYEMIGQTGRNGFFGPYDVNSAGGTGFSLNFWPGLQAPGNLNRPGAPSVTSSSDARWRTQYTEFFPQIVINPAISLQGSYYIGGFQDPLLRRQVNATGTLMYPGVANVYDSELVVKESAGAHTAMSPGYWNWFQLSAKLPWGNVSIGKRPSRFGMGLVYDGYTAASNSVSISAPFGPLLIGVSGYPGRRSNHGGAFDPIQDDGSNIRAYNFTWGATYSSGPLQTGFAISHVNRWRPAERVAWNNPSSSRERWDREMDAFIKYNNGRFFFNAEIDTYWRKQFQYPTGAQKLAGTIPQIYNDTEALVYGIETGVLCGPAKVSFLFVNASDDDRRALYVSGAGVNTDVFKANNFYALSGEFGNTFTVCRPYTYLMGFHYGGGVANGYDFISGIGHLRGRWTAGTLYAARFDYAVAANLNVFFTGAKGVQWNKSYGWGYIGLNPANGAVAWATKNNGAVRSPAIPDDDMGWELGSGFDWKLLEGLVLRGQYSYWQPGKWFNYACVSRSNPLWKVPTTDLALWGTAPNRSIDAIFGLNVLVAAEF